MVDDKGSIFAFVFPNQLEIVTSEPQTHKQILTLYNPYHFPIKFKVKCTNSHDYSVIEPYGILRASSSIDIIIRHVAVQFQRSPGLETFRIEICSVHNQKISGLVDIPVRIMEAEPKLIVHDIISYHQQPVLSSRFLRPRFGVTTPLVMVCIGAVAVCVSALMLPTDGLDVRPMIPNWLHLSVNLKLVCAYILGLVTLVLLRPG
ncbi:hypothetical protein DINM_000526 [Dirofilaria immitis]|nr:hypothetical protein [Dirofilaria immitis]